MTLMCQIDRVCLFVKRTEYRDGILANNRVNRRNAKINGWAYQFDLSHLEDLQDEDAINGHIRNIYLSAVEAPKIQKVKEGPLPYLELFEETGRG